MRFLGLNISRTKTETKALSPVLANRGGWFRIMESVSGAFQTNLTVDFNSVLSFHAVYACITLIASDIAKLRVKLVELDGDGIWTEVVNPAFSPVLRRPNPFQNRIQFWENWILSKLMRGNTYALKFRDQRGVVTRLYILDPNRVIPLIADDGSVFYALQVDNISGLQADVMVPAREIIHDRMNCLFHPLVGTSPIFACGLAATQGLSIENNSTRFFNNRAMPGGILTAPGAIHDDTAARLKAAWETNYSGENYAKVAVLGDGLTFEPMVMTSVESQLIEQLKWTAETVCSTFHVPPYKIGVGAMPTNNNVQTLNVEYYSQCLQSLIEAAEECLDEGLGIGWERGLGTEFDVDNLLRMDTLTQVMSITEAVGSGVMAPNEGRKRLDLKPKKGGDSPYLQQQNYSLEALAKRDAQDDPFGKAATTPQLALPPPDDTAAAEPAADGETKAIVAAALLRKELGLALAA